MKRLIETWAVHKNQQYIPVELSYSHWTSNAGEHFFTTILRDLRERKTLLADLQQAKIRAETNSHFKSYLLSVMDHELRTPLNVISGFCELLQTRLSVEQQRNYIQHIAASTQRMLYIINDIMDFNDNNPKNRIQSIGDVDLTKIIKEILQNIEQQAKQAGISVKNQVSSSVFVKANPVYLHQVLLNLLTNAIKYNRKSGYILVRSEIKPSTVSLFIEDNGSGIDKNKVPLFQPFQRLLDRPETIAGQGLGLAIAKMLMDKMGGSIGFKNNTPTGTIFWIELPRTQHNNLNIIVTVHGLAIQQTVYSCMNVKNKSTIGGNRCWYRRADHLLGGRQERNGSAKDMERHFIAQGGTA